MHSFVYVRTFVCVSVCVCFEGTGGGVGGHVCVCMNTGLVEHDGSTKNCIV